jgi:very-short-patch-repair endonuclease
MKTEENVMMGAELAQKYEVWMESHRKASKGERKRKLTNAKAHAEKMFIVQVWWPAFGNFKGLHPEYEIRDFKDGWRYLDFAYISEGMRVCIEIDGFGSHWRDISRSQFSDNLMRQNHLIIDGWLVLRFSYDDLVEKPRRCQQIIQQLLGRWKSEVHVSISPVEQAIYHFACAHLKPITPTVTASSLGMHRKTATKYLHSLVDKDLIVPVRTKSERVVRYRVNPSNFHK